MTIGASIFLIALGAILTFAVSFEMSGISIETIGIILMVAGAIGLVISLFLWATASNRTRRAAAVDPDGRVTETTTRQY